MKDHSPSPPPQSLLEVIQTRAVLISLWVLLGSVLGGLLLLALLVFCLWKVSMALAGAWAWCPRVEGSLIGAGKTGFVLGRRRVSCPASFPELHKHRLD